MSWRNQRRKRTHKAPFLLKTVLLQWNVRRRFGSADSRISVLNRFVGRCKLTCHVPNHLRDDLDASEVLAIVDCDGEVDHLR